MFTVKKLQGSERFDGFMISLICFHSRMENPEEARDKVEHDAAEHWGAFTAEGVLAARVIDNPFSLNIDGTAVTGGGIGGVATLPEYRNMGAIQAIFQSLLPDAYNRGEVISILRPFNHSFYRKQGYEAIPWRNCFELTPHILTEYRFNGKAVQWNNGDPAEDYLRLYQDFCRNYNCSVNRNADVMRSKMQFSNLLAERKFSYLLYQDGIPKAYIIFQDVRHDPAAILKTEEVAWSDRDGFLSILGFLSRLSSDYGTIRLNLPAGIDLINILHSVHSDDVKLEPEHDFMVRVINAERLLQIISKPADCDFTIQVLDDILPENNRTWRVTQDSVLPTDAAPDMTAGIRVLAQIALGGISIEEACLREDFNLNGKEEMIRRVFIRKPIWMAEHF